MMKLIQFTNKLLFGLILLSIIACGENHALKEETIYFDDNNADWLIEDTVDYSFIMIDNYGISKSFSMINNSYYFGKSWTTILGINTEMTFSEYHYQSFTSSYGQNFTISLSAGFEPFGDEIYIVVGETAFAYDIKFKTVSRLDLNGEYLSKTMYEDGYGDETEINSIVEILNNYTVNDIVYAKVLHFTLKDFSSKWHDNTVTEIYVAQKYGLIKYALNGGTEYYRN
ncbi:MAG: hypothetical protein U9Q83_05660 [Bacteroidota bacterium]|nr:hypothetical protein [Bacteroidota bacterium]